MKDGEVTGLALILQDLGSVFSSVLTQATSLVNWIAANPLVYLWIILAIILVIIGFVKGFVRGV